MEDNYYSILRMVHMAFAIFWAGAVMYNAWFIIPTVKKLGPDGNKFMQQLPRTNMFPMVMLISGTMTVLFGILLLEYLSQGFQSYFFESKYGMILSLGGGLAIVAYLLGVFINMPASMKLGKIGQAIAASGAGPTPEQAAEMTRLKKRLSTFLQVIAGLIFVATVLMAGARYFAALMT
jgi:uncharacterized membrane protein